MASNLRVMASTGLLHTNAHAVVYGVTVVNSLTIRASRVSRTAWSPPASSVTRRSRLRHGATEGNPFTRFDARSERKPSGCGELRRNSEMMECIWYTMMGCYKPRSAGGPRRQSMSTTESKGTFNVVHCLWQPAVVPVPDLKI